MPEDDKDELIQQLIGRAFALEYLLAQTMILVLQEKASPTWSIEDLRLHYERSLRKKKISPEIHKAASETADRIYEVVESSVEGS